MGKDTRTYVRLHDGMPENHKIVGLSDAAFRLYVEALCWCGRNRTDGRIPAAALRRLGSVKAQKEIGAAGLIHVGDHGSWEIHDYLEHQRSKAEIEAGVEQRRSAGRSGGLARSKRVAKQKPSESLSETSSKTQADTETDTKDNPPSPPDGGRRKPKTACPDIFAVTDRMRGWAAENTPLVSPDDELGKFLSHHRSKDSRFSSWDQAFQTWMRNAQTYAHRQQPQRSRFDANGKYVGWDV